MLLRILLFIIFILMLNLKPALATESNICSVEMLHAEPNNVLPCFLSLPETIAQPYTLLSKIEKETGTIEQYQLNSTYWPLTTLSTQGQIWQHTLTLYKPKFIQHDTALLFITGGIRYPASYQIPEDDLFFKAALQTRSIIVTLSDVPNQYLKFEDNIPRREDGIIAYTFNRYLDNPAQHAYWPLQLAMTKATLKAMTAVQTITAKDIVPIHHFVLTGASKRGWTAWLTSLSDERVSAIMPIVIDIFNMQANIAHIYDAYQGWPEAFKDYVEQGVDKRFNTPAFKKLTQIVDPLSYSQHDLFKKRLQIPKYIVSAAQDQFFPPDSNNFYVNQLPGRNHLRMFPNEGHKINASLLFPTLLSYYQSFLQNLTLPQLTWQTNQDQQLIRIRTNTKPQLVKVWQAINPAKRDFRYETGIRYSSTLLENGQCNQNHCDYVITVQAPEQGFKAYFVEVIYNQPENFSATTPGYVISKSNSTTNHPR